MGNHLCLVHGMGMCMQNDLVWISIKGRVICEEANNYAYSFYNI